jgi:hypothetical protein
MKCKTQLHSINQSRAIKPTLLLPLSIHFEPNYTREKDFANAFSEIDVIKIPEYLIDNIFGARIFQQKVDIPIGYQPCSFFIPLFVLLGAHIIFEFIYVY